MGDGRIGEQPFEVVLEHGRIAANQQGAQARTAHQPEPGLGAAEHRPQPCQQKNPRLDHGGRVQVRRHGGGRSHRTRQPEVKGELRALGECAHQDQHQRREVQRMRLDFGGRGQHCVQVIAAHDMAEHQHPRQHAQPARAGDRERHAGASPGVFAVVPIPNQQKREQAGQFPEQCDLDQVARQHHAHHGAHEGKEEREEARHRVGRRHVVARIEHHQAAHPQNQQAEHPGKPVQPQRQVQPQLGNPFNVLNQHAAIGNVWKVQSRLDGAKHRDETRQGGLGVPRIGRQDGSQQAANEWEEYEGGQRHARPILEGRHSH